MAPYADFCGAISRERKSTKSVENLGTSQQKYGVMEKTWSPAYSVNDEIDVSSRKDLAIDDKKNDQKIISSEEQKFVQEIYLETRKNDCPTIDSTTSVFLRTYGTNSNLNCADDSTQRIADHLFMEPVSELSDKRDTLVIEPTAEDMSLPQELSPSECT
ncbi:unnamed protein product [Rhizophagus irregularis]|nr:unnamed protein product [Rhizophagus irregularis]